MILQSEKLKLMPDCPADVLFPCCYSGKFAPELFTKPVAFCLWINAPGLLKIPGKDRPA
jgi:hypothetical protein